MCRPQFALTGWLATRPSRTLRDVDAFDRLRHAADHGLVTLASAQEVGVSRHALAKLARRGVLARVARGVYAVAASARAPQPAVITRSWRVVLSHMSAAAWWGVDLPVPSGVLHVTAPRNRGRRRDEVRGVRLHRGDLASDEVVVVRGVPVTSPLRTALDIARSTLPLEQVVAVIDAFYRVGLVRPAEFEAAARSATGPGSRRARLVAGLADPRSGSILESLCRMLLWAQGLAPETTQFSLEHPTTGWVGYLDFAWPSLRVALECDGYEWHADREAFQKDRRRWSALNRAGWLSGVVTWHDVVADPDYVVALVRDLLSSRDVQHTNELTPSGRPRGQASAVA